MSILTKITTGGVVLPPRLNISGVPGVGKTTLLAKAPGVVFACAEDGLGPEHASVPRFLCGKFSDLTDLITALRRETHSHKWLAIDTADWLERLLIEHLLQRDGKKSIEDYGYGKGFTLLSEEYARLLSQLDLLRKEKLMGIAFLSHVEVKLFQDPSGTSWDRYQPKGSKQVVSITKEWVDAHLFAVFQMFQAKDNKRRAIGGERVIHTSWTPAWDAKNRLGLPETLPMEWAALENAIDGGRSSEALGKRAAELFATAQFTAEQKAAAEKKYGESPTAETLAKLPIGELRVLVSRLENLQPAANAAA